MRTAAIVAVLILALAAPASAQWVYMNEYPGSCIISQLFFPIPGVAPKYIYVYAPGRPDVAGATFRIQSDVMGPEDVVSMTPAPGVTIVGGDLFGGITLSWSPHELLHEAVLALDLIDNPPHQPSGMYGGQVWTDDVTLATAGGDIPCEPSYTSTDINIDCFWFYPFAYPPDTVDVAVGAASHYEFLAGASGQGGASLTVEDAPGWVTGWDPSGVWGSCPVCDWDYAHVVVDVFVPEGTPPDTFHPVVTRLAWWDGQDREWHRTTVLRTIVPVATEPSSLGKLKTLYRKPE